MGDLQTLQIKNNNEKKLYDKEIQILSNNSIQRTKTIKNKKNELQKIQIIISIIAILLISIILFYITYKNKSIHTHNIETSYIHPSLKYN